MSNLLEAQFAFARMVPKLLTKAEQLGFAYKGGDWMRDPRCPYGSKSSRHRAALALDLHLFLKFKDLTPTRQTQEQAARKKDGLPRYTDESWVYLERTEDHAPLGAWWQEQGGIWGGDFDDGNHYEWPLP